MPPFCCEDAIGTPGVFVLLFLFELDEECQGLEEDVNGRYDPGVSGRIAGSTAS